MSLKLVIGFLILSGLSFLKDRKANAEKKDAKVNKEKKVIEDVKVKEVVMVMLAVQVL
jgi:hypothetical protein